MKRIQTIIWLVTVLVSGSARAAVHLVPEEYATIQSAVDASESSDTVIVATGTYSGSGNRNINFNGKSITVRSTDPTDPQIINNTVIDCEGQGRGFVFYTAESAGATIAGLTVTNGYAFLGGAIYCYNNSSPSVNNCVLTGNSAALGGAIACASTNGPPEISNCTITANSALVGGGAIYCNGDNPTIRNCVISGNSALSGGAIYSHNAGNPVITNCTITANTASDSAGAIYSYKASNLTINNCILWGDTAANASEILVGNLGAPTSVGISYCDIQNPDESVVSDTDCTIEWGQGNIDLDPGFAGTDRLNESQTAADHHLLEGSPCVDAGDPSFVAAPDETDIDGEPRILGAKVDIGADELATPVPAEVKITPKTLSISSNGKWISCSITLLDENYGIGDVNTDTITLNAQLSPVSIRTDQQEQKLLVKFDRSAVQEMVSGEESPAMLNVAGELNDGMVFAGADTIIILPAGSKKNNRWRHAADNIE
jgi:predicted outer membrane repeat protein